MSGILQAWTIDGEGNAHVTSSESLGEPLKEGYAWYHFDRNDPATQALFTQDDRVDNIATQTLLAADTRPRTIVRGRDVLINLRGVNLNEGEAPEDIVKILSARLDDIYGMVAEYDGVRQTCAVSLGRMKAESGLAMLRKHGKENISDGATKETIRPREARSDQRVK